VWQCTGGWTHLDRVCELVCPRAGGRLRHPLHFWVDDTGMVFFFALAAKEVFEATLPGGSLASPRRAL
jgi:Na+/H+ antiporter NhaA